MHPYSYVSDNYKKGPTHKKSTKDHPLSIRMLYIN